MCVQDSAVLAVPANSLAPALSALYMYERAFYKWVADIIIGSQCNFCKTGVIW